MITPRLYETLPHEERRLWHSHVYEVKSGMLVMPNRVVPEALWEVAENKEMEQVVKLYGKVYHLWQTDKGHTLPLGEPQLMTSFTADGQFDFEKHVGERDKKLGTDYRRKAEARQSIQTPEVHPGDLARYIFKYSIHSLTLTRRRRHDLEEPLIKNSWGMRAPDRIAKGRRLRSGNRIAILASFRRALPVGFVEGVHIKTAAA